MSVMRGVLVSIPAGLSAVVLAAHFLRAGWGVAVLAALAMVPLLLVTRRWAQRLVQVALVLGAAEWVRTLAALAAQRQQRGEPWARMAVILGAVAAFTGLSAILLEARGKHERSRTKEPQMNADGA